MPSIFSLLHADFGKEKYNNKSEKIPTPVFSSLTTDFGKEKSNKN